MDINFAGTSFDTVVQYNMIRDLLLKELCIVEFTKLDGEVRQMPCTLMPGYAVGTSNHQLDLTGTPCLECKDGYYKETGIQDDMQGVLHCDECRHEVRRYIDKKINYETLSVFCTDKQEWRSFKTMRVISVKSIPTKYTITLEEDPETQDLIMPLPPELLSQMGWNEGDTLHWTDNEDGSFSLSKKDLTSEST